MNSDDRRSGLEVAQTAETENLSEGTGRRSVKKYKRRTTPLLNLTLICLSLLTASFTSVGGLLKKSIKGRSLHQESHLRGAPERENQI